MISRNEWVVCGNVVATEEKKLSLVLSIKGKVSIPELYKTSGTIPCIVSKKLLKDVNLHKCLTITGHMLFSRGNFLLAESITDKKGVRYECEKGREHLQKKFA